MKIGYACVNPVLPGSGFRKCKKSNVTESLLNELISGNLDALEKLIDYNIEKNIKLFRIGSDLIPFASDEINGLNWTDLFAERFTVIGQKIRDSGMRVSMHPGQYTVLNSPDENVRKNAVKDLEYHCAVLDLLGTDKSNKIVLHAGGAYGDKEQASDNFISAYQDLYKAVRDRVVIENDDRIYNIEDILTIANKLCIPVVFDNLHNTINPAPSIKTDHDRISECAGTWKHCDGNQKIHYSQQAPEKRTGAHSEHIDAAEFLSFCECLPSDKIDVMLEVKDKNLSAIKCILCTDPKEWHIKKLEEEWSLYKYLILEKSPRIYNEIRQLLRNKNEYPALAFYHLIDEALAISSDRMNARNAALHVWGYFKDKSDITEKNKFFKSLDNYCDGKKDSQGYKTMLLKLADKYEQHYILKSYYLFV